MNQEYITCVGSLNVDSMLYVEEFCDDDGERVIKEIHNFSGGNAGNICAGIGRLGGRVCFWGNIGKDNNTEMLLKDFDSDNVDYSYTKKTDKPNSSCYAIINEKGERRLYSSNFIDLGFEDFPDELYEKTKLLIFTSLCDKEILKDYVKIARKAKEHSIKTFFSPGNIFVGFGFDAIRELIQLSDYLFLSKSELNSLSASPEELVEICDNLILTKGKEGVEHHRKDEETKIYPQRTVDNIVDTTGAGDCFLAAFVKSLGDGRDADSSIRFAMEAAALSITKKGARAMPTSEEMASS